MKGHVSTETTSDYHAAARRGEETHSPCSFTLTIVSDDLDRTLADPDCAARILGTVHVPALPPDPLPVTEGVFNLLVEDPDQVDARQMLYRMKLRSTDGARYYFSGFKTIRNDQDPDTWSDTTILYVTVHEDDTDAGPVAARGILTIHPKDFATQLTTMDVRGATGMAQRLEATTRFGKFFADALFDVYGGVATPLDRFDPAVRRARSGRCGSPPPRSIRSPPTTA